MISVFTGCLVLVVLIACCAAWGMRIKRSDDSIEWVGGGIAILVLGSFISFVLCIGLSFIGDNKMWYDVEHQDIVSLNLGRETAGSFILGCGNFGGQEYYVYFAKQEAGGYRRRKVRVEDVVVQEFEDCVVGSRKKFEFPPRIEWQDCQCLPPTWVWPWSFSGLLGPRCRATAYRIEVPTGTIVRQFEL